MAKPAGPTPERTCPTCYSGLKREVVAISMCSDPWHDGSTPVAPAGAQPPRQHYVEIPANRRVVGVFSDGSYMIEHGDGQREHVYVRRSAKGYQDGLAPVAPEPPTLPSVVKNLHDAAIALDGPQSVPANLNHRRFREALEAFKAWEPTGEPAPCVWRENGDGLWDTSCGREWEFIDDGPKENRVKFCIECGQPVQSVPFTVER